MGVSAIRFFRPFGALQEAEAARNNSAGTDARAVRLIYVDAGADEEDLRGAAYMFI
jgi:hypothetical protein